MATSADVPGKFDVVINGKGYVFLDALAPNIPFRTHRAVYSYTPTFLERQNVSGAYGDNQQEFFLTASQNDWSEGEQQKFYRSGDKDSVRRYWQGQNIDISIPGQVQLQPATTSLSYGTTAVAACGTGYVQNSIFVADATNLKLISNLGSVTSAGAHGAGAPYARGMVSDGTYVYIAGASDVIAYNINTPGFTTFSAGAYMALAFAANTLYGVTSTMSDFGHFDTSGNFTSLYTFKDAKGGSHGVVTSLKADGAQIYVLRASSEEFKGGELWVYNGTGLSPQVILPANFRADQMEVVNGIVFIAGAYLTSSTQYQPAILYYANGTPGLLWKSPSPTTYLTLPALTAFQNGLVFTDESTGNFMFWNPDVGGVSSIGSFTQSSVSWNSSSAALLAASGTSFAHLRQGSTIWFFPASSTASSGYVQTSQFDFDNSLTKQFRGIVVDFDSATDGDGGTVDIAYRVNGVGNYTTLASGVTAGQEYTLSNISGRTIQLQVTLNKGTSTAGPVLKRIYVRAAPQLRTFRKREYILDLTGAAPTAPRRLRDSSPDSTVPFDGVANLVTAAQSTSPVSITDRLGTFTGIIEPENFEVYEMHAENQNPGKSGSYVVRVGVREV